MQGIESASSSVLTFLDTVVDEGLSSNGDAEINLSILADLCNHLSTSYLTVLTRSHPVNLNFMTILFEHRKSFLALAAQSLSSSSNASAIITWVDVVLCRMAEVITVVASGTLDAQECYLSNGTLKVQQINDNLGASIRLPRMLPLNVLLSKSHPAAERWDAVPHVLVSDRASPAAKRLALRLTFGVYVMAPTLGSHESWLENGYVAHILGFRPLTRGPSLQPESLSQVMLEYLKTTTDSEYGSRLSADPHLRLRRAMAVVVLAVSFSPLWGNSADLLVYLTGCRVKSSKVARGYSVSTSYSIPSSECSSRCNAL